MVIGGGPKGMLAPLSNYLGGGPGPLPPLLFLRLWNEHVLFVFQLLIGDERGAGVSVTGFTTLTTEF